MELVDMSLQKRYAMMRKRHAFLDDFVKNYTSLEEFTREYDEWFAMLGIELTLQEEFISLYIALDCLEYEKYYVILGENGHLTISEIIAWKDDVGANSFTNIFTRKCYLGEDVIPKAIHKSVLLDGEGFLIDKNTLL